jgi:hypothetical protein
MGDPEVKERRSKRRKRNFIAKDLRENKLYQPKRIDKRRYDRKKEQNDETRDY